MAYETAAAYAEGLGKQEDLGLGLAQLHLHNVIGILKGSHEVAVTRKVEKGWRQVIYL